ncbi:MAG: hypothetical protein SPF66_09825, partial [Bacteroidaceae bacterium]|nr:hypothetical protein [Bacteroidaceae bacterium]
ANGCNSRLSGQNTSKSSRGAFNLKVESSRNGVLGQAGGGQIESPQTYASLVGNMGYALWVINIETL